MPLALTGNELKDIDIVQREYLIGICMHTYIFVLEIHVRIFILGKSYITYLYRYIIIMTS